MDKPVRSKKGIGKWVLFGGIAVAAVVVVVVISSMNSSVAAGKGSQLEVAARYLDELQYEQAIVVYNEILSIDPKNIDAYEGLVDAYIGMGNFDKAYETLADMENKFIAGMTGENSEYAIEDDFDWDSFYTRLDAKYQDINKAIERIETGVAGNGGYEEFQQGQSGNKMEENIYDYADGGYTGDNYYTSDGSGDNVDYGDVYYGEPVSSGDSGEWALEEYLYGNEPHIDLFRVFPGGMQGVLYEFGVNLPCKWSEFKQEFNAEQYMPYTELAPLEEKSITFSLHEWSEWGEVTISIMNPYNKTVSVEEAYVVGVKENITDPMMYSDPFVVVSPVRYGVSTSYMVSVLEEDFELVEEAYYAFDYGKNCNRKMTLQEVKNLYNYDPEYAIPWEEFLANYQIGTLSVYRKEGVSSSDDYVEIEYVEIESFGTTTIISVEAHLSREAVNVYIGE